MANCRCWESTSLSAPSPACSRSAAHRRRRRGARSCPITSGTAKVYSAVARRGGPRHFAESADHEIDTAIFLTPENSSWSKSPRTGGARALEATGWDARGVHQAHSFRIRSPIVLHSNSLSEPTIKPCCRRRLPFHVPTYLAYPLLSWAAGRRMVMTTL